MTAKTMDEVKARILSAGGSAAEREALLETLLINEREFGRNQDSPTLLVPAAVDGNAAAPRCLIYDGTDRGESAPLLVHGDGQLQSADPLVLKVHELLTACLDFYSTEFGLASYDNAGTTVKAIVHFKTRSSGYLWDAAQWNFKLGALCFGDGGLEIDSQRPLAWYIDMVAHEFTHAVLDYWMPEPLASDDEGGALSESWPDALGATIKHWYAAHGGQITAGDYWEMAPDSYPRQPGRVFRSLSRPAVARRSQCRREYSVHANSGVPSRAFCLFATSFCNAFNLPLWRAAAVWLRAARAFTGTCRFNDAAAFTVHEASKLDGIGNAAADFCRAAWAEVEVPAQTVLPLP